MTKLFIHENATENVVYEMAAILSRGRRVTDMGKSNTPKYYGVLVNLIMTILQ